MKNKYNVFLLVFILILVGGFAITASDTKIPYLSNYGTNFRRNVKGIAQQFGWNLPTPIDDFLSKTPTPLTTEEKLKIIEKDESADLPATPTPEIPLESDVPLKVSSKIVAVKNAYSAAYANYKSNLLCAVDTLLTCYNSDGSVAWQTDIQISTPILKTAGDYILIAEKNANKFYLFKGSKQVWVNTCENAIITADVSKNGDVVIVSDKPHFKGSVSVINRKGDTVFQWNSGKYEVLDADISPISRVLAVSLLNTDVGADTKISFFNLKELESFNSIDLTDCIAFDLEFCGENLNAIADNKIITANTDGNITNTKDFDGKNLHRYQVEENGYTLCVFDNNNVSEINILTNRASNKVSFESKAFPEHVFISDGYLLYNDDRQLFFSTLSGKNPKKYNCTRDIYNLLILDSDTISVIYNSSIEFIKL